jgi:hypothetical protein
MTYLMGIYLPKRVNKIELKKEIIEVITVKNHLTAYQKYLNRMLKIRRQYTIN